MEDNNEVKNEETTNKGKYDKMILCIIMFSTISVIIVTAILGIIIYDCISNNTADKILEQLQPLKPIIYLYPQETTEITVKLGNKENITCSYPEYNEGWKVIAEPNGTLTDVRTQRKLYALYWEGKNMTQPEMTEGFIVKGQDTIKFLEEKLEILGLNEKESQEFIIYWLPKMQNNAYNYIRFATLEEINNYMPLELSVEPDSLIRVLMQYKTLNEYVEVKEQELVTPQRNGFTVVEWGGTEIK